MKHSVTLLVVAFAMLFHASLYAQTCSTLTDRTAPDSRFTVHDNQTVSDKHTGLMWQQCAVGFSGINCSAGTVTQYSWDEALKYADSLKVSGGFADYTDWRLPNRNELATLVEFACQKLAINETVFPNTPEDNFWTSTPSQIKTNGNESWYVNFAWGDLASGLRAYGYSIRLVRNN